MCQGFPKLSASSCEVTSSLVPLGALSPLHTSVPSGKRSYEETVDGIIFKEKEPLVYYLSRQPRTTLILVSNDADDVVKLPERALSTLQPVLIYAAPYTQEEVAQILKERAERAFRPNVVADKLLATVAKTACDIGDVRFGFRVLLSAALMAEKARRQTIEAGDVASAVEEENRVRKLRDLETLRDKLLKLKKKYEKD